MIITDNSFEQTISSNELVLVDFWAIWCNPCKMLSPILDEISKENNLLIAKINVDDNPIKAAEYDVRSVPSMLLFKNGKVVHKIVGAMPKHRILKELSEWI